MLVRRTQQALEDRVDDSFGDVRIHIGPKAVRACGDVNARAVTVGNHITFNHGEYDPESAEGQFLLAHEPVHVKQQNGGAPLSMRPKPNAELEIEPDPQLEREVAGDATETAAGGEPLVVNRVTDVPVHRTACPTSSR
ncbi:eCIS core domain-containing protein [Halopiger djelfimassiliensis]|uniref:eCIS core domain-containing protein n=1 Tax=Halopiger djelfimassiliensis TaxID=1293047 RepID=UPI0006778E86